jgi:5-methylcytosine-specific restriction endonuclease McrA
MRLAFLALLAWAFFLGLVVMAKGEGRPDAMTEIRYCGPVQRDAQGRIARSRAVLAAFEKAHPCPATGTGGSCVGWAMDHVIPLACGGCDAVWNLQWLPDEIKNCAGTKCKDRFERRIYCRAVL